MIIRTSLDRPRRNVPGRSPSIFEVLDALEWVRKELMRKGSPDFIRARKCEDGVQSMITKMLRTKR